MDVSLKKDSKGPSFFLSHRRSGITEGVWLTEDELKALLEILKTEFG